MNNVTRIHPERLNDSLIQIYYDGLVNSFNETLGSYTEHSVLYMVSFLSAASMAFYAVGDFKKQALFFDTARAMENDWTTYNKTMREFFKKIETGEY